MDRSLFRYILRHTWRDQLALLALTLISFPLIYVNLELPKKIVNEALQGKHIPAEILGFPVTQVSYLMALSLLLLTLITINGALKYVINVYAGIVGERTLRRLRHDLYWQVMRFPLAHFKTTSPGEIIPMIVAETEPVGGFIGESFVVPIFQGGLLATYVPCASSRPASRRSASDHREIATPTATATSRETAAATVATSVMTPQS